MLPQETKETFEVILANRHFLYMLFYKTFGREADDAYLDILNTPAVRDAFMLLSQEEGDTMEKAAAFVGGVEEKRADDDLLGRLRHEYMRLFIGPEKLIAPPWESVYRSKEGLLFQGSTLTVREIYRKEGYLPEGYPNVPDDSLALELAFMTRMAEKSLAALRNDQADEFLRTLSVQESFLRFHLLYFVPKLLERMEASAFRLFYPQMTRILLAFAQTDLELVEDMLKM